MFLTSLGWMSWMSSISMKESSDVVLMFVMFSSPKLNREIVCFSSLFIVISANKRGGSCLRSIFFRGDMNVVFSFTG